jgi:hypothetical protein
MQQAAPLRSASLKDGAIKSQNAPEAPGKEETSAGFLAIIGIYMLVIRAYIIIIWITSPALRNSDAL